MKNILTIIAASVLVLFFSSQISASATEWGSGYSEQTGSGGEAGSMTEAIKHAEMAKTHGDDAKKFIQHAEMSLKFANEFDRGSIGEVSAERTKHIDASIAQLREAITHAEMGHTDVASKSIDEALNEMRQFTTK